MYIVYIIQVTMDKSTHRKFMRLQMKEDWYSTYRNGHLAVKVEVKN